MSPFVSFLSFLLGLAVGGGVVWLVQRAKLNDDAQWSDRFKALAADTLNANNQAFLDLAESRLKQSEQAVAATLERKSDRFDQIVKPVGETLQKMDAQIQALEIKREGAYRELSEMVKVAHESQLQLRSETSQLLQALRTPASRGRWGEIQLRRILEMTGMSAHTKDFSEQKTFTSDNGALRPDVIVNLPGERCIIIDSKVPLSSYLDAMQSADETGRQNALAQHAKQVREHVKLLSAKAYWDQVEGTPEFVTLFLPGEHFLGAALDGDPTLMDYCVTQKIILATPMTLVALLRTVAYGWRQESLRENAQKIGALGGEMYAALVSMTDHIMKLGDRLDGGLKSYNAMIGSLERNVLSKARRLRDFGAGKDGKALPDALETLDIAPRRLTVADDGAKEDAA